MLRVPTVCQRIRVPNRKLPRRGLIPQPRVAVYSRLPWVTIAGQFGCGQALTGVSVWAAAGSPDGHPGESLTYGRRTLLVLETQGSREYTATLG